MGSLALALLLAMNVKDQAKTKPGHPDADHFVLRVSPRILMPPPAQGSLMIVLEQKGDEESDYCANVELAFGSGPEAERVSAVAQDCDPWAVHVEAEREWAECNDLVCVAPDGMQCDKHCKAPREVARYWSWSTGGGAGRLRFLFGPGMHEVHVTVRFANGRYVTKAETWHVTGGGGEQ